MEVSFGTQKFRVYTDGKVERFYRNKYWREVPLKANIKGYYVIYINGKTTFRHRLIGYCYLNLDIDNPESLIDHIDRNPRNNNLNNLRVVSPQTNVFNSGAKGWKLVNGKYLAQIGYNYKKIYLGSFSTQEEARNAYLAAKEKYHTI